MASGTGKRSTKRKSPGRRNNRSKKKQQEAFRNEVILWIALAVAIILFVSNLGFGGVVGGMVSDFFFGVFGLLSYIVPILLFVGTAFLISNKKNQIAGIKFFSGIMLAVFLCLFFQLVLDREDVYSAKAAFVYARANKSGGGFIGGLLEALLCPNIGLIGTYVADIAVLIISFVLLTEKSLLSPMKKSGQVIYDSAREDAARRRELHERKREEQKERREEKARRMDKKAVGVAVDTRVLPKKAAAVSDEVNEIRMDDYPDFPEVKEEERIPLVSEQKAESDQMQELIRRAEADAEAPAEDVFSHMTISYEEPAEERLEDPVPDSDFMQEIRPEFADAFPEEEMPQEPFVPEQMKEEPEPVYAEEPAASFEHKNPKQSAEEITENVEKIEQEIQAKPVEKKYVFPPVSLLKYGDKNASGDSKAYLQETAMKLQQTLKNFGVNVTITNVSCGPTVTRYELQPEMGVKVSKIVNLSDDIKLNLAAADIRIEAPIPGKPAIGIEVPNKKSVPVMFRELIESQEFVENKSAIAFAAGKDIGGKVIVTDIAKMPHVYNGIPHLLIPVVTDPKKAAGALHWAVTEMTERYQKFAQYNVRDIKGYNQKVEGISDIEDETKPQKMPQIVIIVDELADLMMVAPGDVEDAICRLAQLARAAGIHLVIATQRPSVNVITGLIKANMPSRIAFSVTSGVDSRTILDMNGAEKLLGKGDMLFYPQGYPKPIRAQGAFVSDREVSEVVSFLTENNGAGAYDTSIEEKMNSASENPTGTIDSGMPSDDRDSYFVDAAKLLVDKEKGSIGMLQRYFKVGFNRAARIMDQLEEAGIVGPEEGTKPRKVLMTEEELANYIEECL